MPDSVFDFSQAHEQESVELWLPATVPARVIAEHLSALGLTVEEDFYRLPRRGQRPPWQSSDACHVTFSLGGDEVRDLDDGMCDLLSFEYNFASLPADLQNVFLNLVEAAHARLGGRLEHHGNSVGRADLRTAFDRYAADIRDEFADEPGTDFLAQLIYEFHAQR